MLVNKKLYNEQKHSLYETKLKRIQKDRLTGWSEQFEKYKLDDRAILCLWYNGQLNTAIRERSRILELQDSIPIQLSSSEPEPEPEQKTSEAL